MEPNMYMYTSEFLNKKTFKNSITNLCKDELANVWPQQTMLHVIVGATGNNSLISMS